jgi:two-component system chemotaxis sensor kinase CheA
MSIDMSQFYQVFFEESQEHLDSMESLLLGLDIDNPDAEQLNAIFRAAHSIKGSAGTFGFTDLAEVTHVLENLLDRIRKGELALRPEMIDAFLDAGDILKELLAAHRGNGEADQAQVAAMCKRLSELTGGAAPAAARAEAPAAPPSEGASPATAEMDASFQLDMSEEDAARAIDNLVAELGEHSVVQVVERAESAEQPWILRFGTGADPEIVRGLLDFVARSDSIRIGPAGTLAQIKGDSGGAYGFFDETPATARRRRTARGGCSTKPRQLRWRQPRPTTPTVSLWTCPRRKRWRHRRHRSPMLAGDTAGIKAGSEGDGFGFFVDVPAPAATPEAAPAVAPVAAAVGTAGTEKAGAAKRTAPKAAAGGETSIRVDVDKVDQLINLIGELVITQAMLAQSASELDPVQFERLHNGLAQLERNTRDMQESVMSIRMMPISVVFSRFPRVVRDLAQKLGKQIELKTIGEGTELDKSLIERISDPLTHLVRNSLDHGVEMPEDRIAKGKSPTGTITLKAYHQSGNIVIEVGDDGAGLNRQKIMSKAREKGIAVHDQMSDNEVWLLIFEPGFSTADVVTEVSGRGVGMDVVKRNISAMGGRVEIESMTGIGTRMTVRLPLTLAILDGMSVAAGKETYIIPLGYVIESLQAERGMIKSVSGVERLIKVRDEYLPVVALYEVFGIPNTITRLDQGIMVVLEADGVKAALFIDALVGQHQVVIKSLESNYRKVAGISGATIMGDGHVALILDVAALVQMAKTALPEAA